MKWKSLVIFATAATLALSGCGTPGPTFESMEEANVTDEKIGSVTAKLKEVQSGSPADMWFIDVDWTDMPGATGYQLQVDSSVDDDGAPRWSNRAFDSKEDRDLFPTTSANVFHVGFDTTIVYRVRALLEDGQISEWTDSNKLKIPAGNVRYEVNGTAPGAFITMRTSTGTSQASVGVPLSTKDGQIGLTVNLTRATPYISARVEGNGSVTCYIYVKEMLVSKNQATGRGASATCSP